MMAAAQKALEQFYQQPILLLSPNSEGRLASRCGDPVSFGWTENEQTVAQWVFEKGQAAGAGTDTLSGAVGLYLPMNGLHRTMGVVGVKPAEPKQFSSPESFRLLETFANEIGGALESTEMSEALGRRRREHS
jgi:two-component system sensor histidine kinase KdpD